MTHVFPRLDDFVAAPPASVRALGLLCNQTAWSRRTGRYLFQSLAERGALRRVFLPEHGLFAELQDQIPLDDAGGYAQLAPGVEFASLYGERESSLYVAPEKLADLDALLIDLQDVGARYYTFATTVSYIFDAIARDNLKLKVYVADRPNPAGTSVEGSLLPAGFESFVGRHGLPHRHGLSLGELCKFYSSAYPGAIDLEFLAAEDSTWEIPPSPNMPGPLTPLVYSGQCLLEGTNLSEGRGTTRPFEIFGAPYLSWNFERAAELKQDGALLRPLQYIPTFHKFAGQVCSGFQIHLTGAPYHSLAHSLKLIRWIREHSRAFDWRHGVYEYRSDRPAIELLAGDPLLLDYLHGKENFGRVRAHLEEAERAWIDQAKAYRLHPTPLTRTTLAPHEDMF